jgi:hypothetical protein
MNERQLDRAIDVAAGTLMAREPGRALSHEVMARVRESAAPAQRSFVWIAAAAGFVLCAAIATAVMNLTPESIVHLPPAAKLAIAQAAVVPAVPIGLSQKTRQTRVVATRIPRTVESATALPPDDVLTIEPIETEPIALSMIDVSPLERETTSIEAISIEPITIEPLSASND